MVGLPKEMRWCYDVRGGLGRRGTAAVSVVYVLSASALTLGVVTLRAPVAETYRQQVDHLWQAPDALLVQVRPAPH